MDVLTQMKLFNKILRLIGVSDEVQALVKEWDGTKTLRRAKSNIDTALPRYEAARSLVQKVQRFEEAPQRLLGRVIGGIYVRRTEALHATTKAYLRSDSLFEAAVAESAYERRTWSDDLHYMIVVGSEWNVAKLALISRYQIAGTDPFEGQALTMRVYFGYDWDDCEMRQKRGYKVNMLILAPEWVCKKVREGQHIKHTQHIKAKNTCVDTVVAFWQKGMFHKDQNGLEAHNAIKIARQLDTPRPQLQKVS